MPALIAHPSKDVIVKRFIADKAVIRIFIFNWIHSPVLKFLFGVVCLFFIIIFISFFSILCLCLLYIVREKREINAIKPYSYKYSLYFLFILCTNQGFQNKFKLFEKLFLFLFSSRKKERYLFYDISSLDTFAETNSPLSPHSLLLFQFHSNP